MAANHHNALEAPTTTAVWDEDRLTLYDATMGVRATQLTVAHLLGLSLSKIRVVSSFVGGSFGSKAMIWPHVTLAALAARQVGRPVRLALTRPQAFSATGQREEQEHHLTLGATRTGRLTAIRHEKLSVTSHFDDWAEPATGVSSQIYDLENFAGAHRLIRGNTMTPTFTRGPGESVAAFVLESSMDELAHELEIDPVDLRLMNHGPNDPRGNPWSSDGLPECLRRGAELFGWDRRNPTPRSRRDGDWLIGDGMAAAGYPVPLFMPEQQARARIYSDGSAVIEAATPEFGTGVGTMMTQVAADGLGLPLEAVSYKLGDSDLPNITSAVGSAGAMMVSAAVHEAANDLRQQIIALAVSDEQSPLHGADPSSVDVKDGRLTLRDEARCRRELCRSARSQSTDIRRSDRSLEAAAARHPARAADLRRTVRGGRRRSGPGPRACPAHARRLRPGKSAQSKARAQPADGRDALGSEPGPAGGQPDG